MWPNHSITSHILHSSIPPLPPANERFLSQALRKHHMASDELVEVKNNVRTQRLLPNKNHCVWNSSGILSESVEKSCSRIFVSYLANNIVHISRDLDLCCIFFFSLSFFAPFKSSNSLEVPYLNLPRVPL